MKQSTTLGVATFILSAMGLLGTTLWSGARASAAGATSEGEQLAEKSDCLSCHAIDHKVVGPSLDEVAKRYAGRAGIESEMVLRIKDGGSGNWGKVPMTPHPDLTGEQIRKMVDWILSLKSEGRAETAASEETYRYKSADGQTVTTNFPVFRKDRENEKVVVDSIFNGWLQFNSTCFRCHGVDATGSSYAPDLRKSLRDGMTKEQFISFAMVGSKAKGMPAWAGFYDNKEMTQIYEYVKARSLELVQEGRPKSSSD